MGVKATLKKGAGGVFDVVVDGDLVYSKHQSGGFPDEEPLVQKIAARPR